MPATPIIVAIAFGFCGLVAFLCGWIGQPSLERPTCRRCRRDVREHAWDERPRCSCGADLGGDRAIRWTGRVRSRSAMVTGLVLVLASVGAAVADGIVHERQIEWADLLPASRLVGAIRRGEEVDRNVQALIRRADAHWLGDAEAVAALDAIVGAVGLDPRLRPRAIERLIGLPALAGPEHAALRALAMTMVGLGRPTPSDLVVEIDPANIFAPHLTVDPPPPPGVVVVIDLLAVNGVPVSGRTVVFDGVSRTSAVRLTLPWAGGPVHYRCRLREVHLVLSGFAARGAVARRMAEDGSVPFGEVVAEGIVERAGAPGPPPASAWIRHDGSPRP